MSTDKLAELYRIYQEDPLLFFKDVLRVELDGQQKDLVLKACRIGSRVMVKSARGTGKALVNGEPVVTPTGLVPIEELSVGDTICNTQGTTSTVTGVYPQEELKDCYRVFFNDNTHVDCSIDHLWTVRYKNCRRRKTITLEQILEDGLRLIRTPTDRCSKGYELRYSVDKIQPVEFESREVPIDPYILGLWLGDGCRGTGVITNIDPEVWTEVKKAGYALGKQGYQQRTVLGLRPQLKKLGIIGNYSFEKSIPKNYLYNTKECRLSILQALMDTDGTIDKNGATTYYSTSLQLANDFIFLARSLGGLTKGIKVKKTTHKDCYVVHFRLDHAERIFRIERKEERRKKRSGGIKYISGVEYIGKLECTCISVDSDDSQFLTREFTPTHNTFTVAGLGLYFISCFKKCNIRVLSPREEHLKNVFMYELKQLHDRMDPYFGNMLDIRTLSVFHKNITSNQLQCLTANPERPESLGGVHGDKQVYMIDEASGVVSEAYTTIIGSLGTAVVGDHIVGVSNPLRGGGFYGDLFLKKKDNWDLLTFTAQKCPRIKQEFIDEMRELAGGEDGDEYRVSVLGEFPRSDGSSFIPPDVVERAVDRAAESYSWRSHPVVMGVDIARSLSGDKTVFVVRQGSKLLDIISFKTSDTMESIVKMIDLCKSHDVSAIYGDATGVGGPVLDRARQEITNRLNIPVIDVVVANKSTDPQQYGNLATQLWGEMRNWLQEADIPNHYDLRRELSEMTWGYTNRSQIQLTPKKSLKTKGIPSPDHADALAMTFFDSGLTIRRRNVQPRMIKRSNYVWI